MRAAWCVCFEGRGGYESLLRTHKGWSRESRSCVPPSANHPFALTHRIWASK